MIVTVAFEILFATAVIVIGILEIILPLLKREPVFPSFRKRRRLEEKLREVEEEVNAIKLERRIAAEQKQAEALRKKETI